ELPTRPDDPGLPRDRPGHPLRPRRLEAQPARRRPPARPGREPLERDPGDRRDPADVPRPYERRRRRAPRQTPHLRPRPAQDEGPARTAYLREGPARPGPRRRRPRLRRLAEALRGVAQEPGLSLQVNTPTIPRRRPTPMNHTTRRGFLKGAALAA